MKKWKPKLRPYQCVIINQTKRTKLKSKTITIKVPVYAMRNFSTCVGPHHYRAIKSVWIESPYPQYPLMAGPGYLYRCAICKHEIKYQTVFGRVYKADWVAAMEYQKRSILPIITVNTRDCEKMSDPTLTLKALFDALYAIKRASNNRHAWYSALNEAAERRDFPNLLFAHKWITALAKTGIYPSSEFTRPGD